MIRLFKNLTKKECILIAILMLFLIVGVILNLKLPEYMSNITKLIQSNSTNINDVLYEGFFMFLFAILIFICSIVTSFLLSNISANFTYNLRNKIFKKTSTLSIEDMNKYSTGSLINRTVNNVAGIDELLMLGLEVVIQAPLMAIFAIMKILNTSIEWSVITIIGVLIIIVVLVVVSKLVIPNFRKRQKIADKLNNVVKENLLGVKVIRAFNAGKYQNKKFSIENQKMMEMDLFNQRVMGLVHPTFQMVLNLVTLGIYITGTYLIINSAFSDKIEVFSNIIVFSNYSMQVIIAFIMMTFLFTSYPRAQVYAERINEILDLEDKIKNGSKKVDKDIKIEFKNVYFKYNESDDYVLKDISFTVSKGEVFAFIGSTGSGKSTIIKLLLRFYDVTEGSILINDIDIKEYDIKDLYEIMGYVSQKAVVKKDSVKNNILYPNIDKVDTEKLSRVLNVSQINNFIAEKEEKEEYLISENGSNLSGGQKQRVAIARAIYKNPKVYLFDDSFSALDYKTDLNLRKALKKYTNDAISIIVAQRIGTIIHADKIMVLEKGECVGIGNHKNLLKNNPIYKEIASFQFQEKELNNNEG